MDKKYTITGNFDDLDFLFTRMRLVGINPDLQIDEFGNSKIESTLSKYQLTYVRSTRKINKLKIAVGKPIKVLHH